MKKTLSLLLTLALLLACLAPALASEPIPLAEMGITFPTTLDGLNGFSQLYPNRVLSTSPYIAMVQVLYWTIPKEQVVEPISAELTADLGRLGGTSFVLIVSETTAEETLQLLKITDKASPADCIELGKKDAYTLYGIPLPKDLDRFIAAYEAASQTDPERYPADNLDLWKQDKELIITALADDLKQTAFDTPTDLLTAAIGSVLSFETTDLDGNKITSEELFSKNRITMVNLWGVWCPNCLIEMADLAQLHARFQEQGCGIVGIEWEKEPIDQVADQARQILSENNITYPNVIYPVDNDFLNRIISGYPTSIFVDQNGVVLARPIEGAYVSKYEATMEELLSGLPAEEEPAEAAAETAAAIGTYRITTVDESGAPVQGTMVQFCSDVLCTMGITGGDGVATFNFPEGGAYSIHILQAPAGYAADSDDYPVPTDALELTITLKKAE